MSSLDIDWNCSDPQLEFIYSTKKFRVFFGGIGSGKTTVGWMASVIHAVENPGSVGMVVVAKYGNFIDVIWPEMEKWVPKELIKDFSETKKRLVLKNGSRILFRSAENTRVIERLRGPTISWFWVDEITILPKLVWDILIGRIREQGSELRGWLTGTPKMNWCYDTFVNPNTANVDECLVLKEIPTYTNVNLPAGYIKTLESQYTGQFYDQEILGKFVSFEGLIYDLTDEMVLSPERIKEITNHEFEEIMYGVDFGFRNPSCVLVMGSVHGRNYIIDEFYERRVTDDELIDVLQNKMDRWGHGKVLCDPSAPASIEKFKQSGIRAEKANNDVLGGIRLVRSLMDTGHFFVSSHCQNMINEFKMYVWEDNDMKEAPVKINDHAMDVCRYLSHDIGVYSGESVPVDMAVVTPQGGQIPLF